LFSDRHFQQKPQYGGKGNCQTALFKRITFGGLEIRFNFGIRLSTAMITSIISISSDGSRCSIVHFQMEKDEQRCLLPESVASWSVSASKRFDNHDGITNDGTIWL
jgi:hypothetical protein